MPQLKSVARRKSLAETCQRTGRGLAVRGRARSSGKLAGSEQQRFEFVTLLAFDLSYSLEKTHATASVDHRSFVRLHCRWSAAQGDYQQHRDEASSGSCGNFVAGACRSAWRFRQNPLTRNDAHGFRVALSPYVKQPEADNKKK